MECETLNPVGKLIASMPLHLPLFVTTYKKIERIGSKEIPTRDAGSGDDEKIRRALEHDELDERLEE
jgi:hypothetical protein